MRARHGLVFDHARAHGADVLAFEIAGVCSGFLCLWRFRVPMVRLVRRCIVATVAMTAVVCFVFAHTDICLGVIHATAPRGAEFRVVTKINTSPGP
jgi:hypothetical protein